MFNNLLESKPKKPKSPGGAFASLVAHVALIGGVAYASANAALNTEEDVQEDVQFVENKPPEPEQPKEAPPPPPDVVVAPPPPQGFQVLTAPVEIPDVIPEIDLSKAVTDEADFSGKGVAGGTSKGVAGGVPQPIQQDQPYFEFQVEKPVMAAPNNPAPRYPDMLKSAGIEGEALVQFVVDTTGRADMSTYKVLKASHDMFGVAVRNALPGMRFFPAEVGGRKVKQLVQQPFVFGIAR
jgi:protein TonB